MYIYIFKWTDFTVPIVYSDGFIFSQLFWVVMPNHGFSMPNRRWRSSWGKIGVLLSGHSLLSKFVIWETQLNQEPTTTKLAQLTTIGPKQLSKLLEVAPRQISQPLGSWKSVDQPRNWASTCWTMLDHGPCFNCRGTPTDQSLRVCRPRCLLQRPGYGDSTATHMLDVEGISWM
jgi:hypothetical protein